MTSWVEGVVGQLAELGPRGVSVLAAILDEVPSHELAALAYDWPTFARPAQIVEPGSWRSYGFLTGRGWGKTASVVSFLLAEVAAGRAPRIALVGQSEAKSVEILVELLQQDPLEPGAAAQHHRHHALDGARSIDRGGHLARHGALGHQARFGRD